jgi:tetratricopeptide (TPR) repeat protein
MSHGKELTARIQEAVRSAKRATEETPLNRFAKLELGQALWASARVAATDEDCFKALQSAERALLDSRAEEEPLPYLVLARFYRHSNRPALAVDLFREYDQWEKVDRRRLLTEAFLVGESAMQLWYREYEASVVEEALTYSETTLLESVDAGYETARNFISLAFVQAALGRTEIAEHTLRRLSPENVQSWFDLIEQAESAIAKDELSAIGQAFALGVDDATIWNALGTFAARFTRDNSLALRLYNIARRLDPNNAVVLTNLARIYLHRGGPEDLVLADEVLRRAAIRASRTFVWWRSLRHELDQRRGVSSLGMIDDRNDPNRAPGEKVNFRDIQKRYAALVKGMEQGTIDAQKRGYIIQQIITDLLALTFYAGDVSGSHSAHGRQVDAAFTYRDVRHRVEVKWKSEPFNQSHLDALHRILEQHAEVRGIVVSMSGFTEGAINYARDIGKEHAVIFIDREEVEQVIDGSLRLEGLLEWKLVQWRRTGEPYARASHPSDGG